ncbi:polysaccharide pyruvyl transferase family protein [Rossellomorea vietnamensis]|uniref:polysaccharide pyruvyl transferase family protein n=1 Tax=Rossellomorea vietnamensis TaxID=218284 RepID=UPI003D273C49
MKKTILVNAYFSNNLGDDLFLKILFDRYPMVDWHLLTPNTKYKETFKQYPNVNIIRNLNVNILGIRKIDLFHKLNYHLLKFSKYDGLVIIGGSIFMEGKNWRRSLEERKLLPSTFSKFNKKSFIIGANFGPFKDEQFVQYHHDFFLEFEDVCFRDSKSYDLFNDLKNVRSAPDVVFNLDNNQTRKKEKSIGFSLINLENRKELKEYDEIYKRKMIKLVKNKINDGYQIKLFSFCEKEGDLALANFVKASLEKKYKDKVEIVNYEGNIHEFLGRFQSCEAIVGTRFHAVILALLNNQKLFPLIYSDKTYNVLLDLDAAENCCFINEMSTLDVSKIVPLPRKLDLETIKNNAGKQFESLDLFVAP